MRLMIILLSQPLFHAPDEYLVILNPFSTYLTNRRCKNVKNLFVSLVNIVVSYDCAGFVSTWFKKLIQFRVSHISVPLTLQATRRPLLHSRCTWSWSWSNTSLLPSITCAISSTVVIHLSRRSTPTSSVAQLHPRPLESNFLLKARPLSKTWR